MYNGHMIIVTRNKKWTVIDSLISRHLKCEQTVKYFFLIKTVNRRRLNKHIVYCDVWNEFKRVLSFVYLCLKWSRWLVQFTVRFVTQGPRPRRSNDRMFHTHAQRKTVCDVRPHIYSGRRTVHVRRRRLGHGFVLIYHRTQLPKTLQPGRLQYVPITVVFRYRIYKYIPTQWDVLKEILSQKSAILFPPCLWRRGFFLLIWSFNISRWRVHKFSQIRSHIDRRHVTNFVYFFGSFPRKTISYKYCIIELGSEIVVSLHLVFVYSDRGL